MGAKGFTATSGALLLLCGLIAGGVCGFLYNWIPSILDQSCGRLSGEPGCLGVSSTACQSQIKIASGCRCSDSGVCDCTTSMVGMIIDWWSICMAALGGFAVATCLLAGIPAVIAGTSKGRSMCCIYTFSCAGAVLFIPFLSIALTFAAVAYFSAKGLANDFTAGDKCGFGYPLAMQTLTMAAGLPSSSNFPAPPPGTCGSIALCSLVQGTEKDLVRNMSLLCGPFSLAGFLMLLGAFACCCCRGPKVAERVGNNGSGFYGGDEEAGWQGASIGDGKGGLWRLGTGSSMGNDEESSRAATALGAPIGEQAGWEAQDNSGKGLSRGAAKKKAWG